MLPTMMLLSLLFALACQFPASPNGTTTSPVQPEPAPAPEATSQANQEQPPATLLGASVVVAPTAPSPGQTIAVTVTNRLDRTIYTEDMKTDCSIVVLELLIGDSWEPLIACGMERKPLVVAIKPGETRTVWIDPRSTNFGVAPGGVDLGFGVGVHRIRFSYRLETEPEGDEPFKVYSPSFQIGP